MHVKQRFSTVCSCVLIFQSETGVRASRLLNSPPATTTTKLKSSTLSGDVLYTIVGMQYKESD